MLKHRAFFINWGQSWNKLLLNLLIYEMDLFTKERARQGGYLGLKLS